MATDAQLPNAAHIAIVAVACGSYVVMLVAEQRWGGLRIGLVAGVTLVPVVVALAVVPRFTGDLWSYGMYGRMLGVHHVSPWTHAPTAFPRDAIFHLVARKWKGTPSVYGPAFTAVSAAGALVVGGGALATRLFYQSLAALALAGAACIVWARTRSAAAVAFLAVHPLVLMYLVNGGRNDILVGVALLGAVVLVSSHRPGAAGVVAALGALVKVTGIVGLVAIVITLIAHGERRATRRMTIAAAAVFGIGYAVAGTRALFAPLTTAGVLFSQSSTWRLLPHLGFTLPDTHVALAVLALLVLVVILRHARGDAATAVTASLGMLSLAAAYTIPGYAVWGLPTATLDHRSRVARIIAATGLVLVVTYEVLRHPVAGTIGSAVHSVAVLGGPVALVALAVALVRTTSPSPDGLPDRGLPRRSATTAMHRGARP